MATAANAKDKPKEKKEKKPNPKMVAYLEKRAKKLAELKAKEPLKFTIAQSFKEARKENKDLSWKDFCITKAKAYNDFWLGQAEKPVGGAGKSIERKKARIDKLKNLLAQLEKETGTSTPAAQ